jgi:hypothetical protein
MQMAAQLSTFFSRVSESTEIHSISKRMHKIDGSITSLIIQFLPLQHEVDVSNSY